MTEEADYYRAAHVLEALAERLGDLDLEVQISGGIVLVTGNVASADQQAQIAAAVGDLCPEYQVRNETTLPHLAEPHPAEQIDSKKP